MTDYVVNIFCSWLKLFNSDIISLVAKKYGVLLHLIVTYNNRNNYDLIIVM